MSEKKLTSAEDSDSDSDDSMEYMNNKYADTDIDDNLNTKLSAIEAEKLDDDRVKESSNRKSQVSMYEGTNN